MSTVTSPIADTQRDTTGVFKKSSFQRWNSPIPGDNRGMDSRNTIHPDPDHYPSSSIRQDGFMVKVDTHLVIQVFFHGELTVEDVILRNETCHWSKTPVATKIPGGSVVEVCHMPPWECWERCLLKPARFYF